MLSVGEIVQSTYFPEVVQIKKCEPFGEFFIIEAIGEESNTFYERILEKDKVANITNSAIVTKTKQRNVDVQKYLIYLLLKNEIQFSNSKALGNAEVIPLPHQIEAVYGRILQTPRVRFLLADDPGAGKTIMAGML